jgi:hypothetical protein
MTASGSDEIIFSPDSLFDTAILHATEAERKNLVAMGRDWAAGLVLGGTKQRGRGVSVAFPFSCSHDGYALGMLFWVCGPHETHSFFL